MVASPQGGDTERHQLDASPRGDDGDTKEIKGNLDCQSECNRLNTVPVDGQEWSRIQERVYHAVSRGAIMGATMRGGFHVISYTLRLLSTSRRKVDTKMVGNVVKKISKDTMSYGLFLGSFSGSFVLLDETIAYLFGREATKSWRALVSGFLSGPCLVLAGSETRHTSLALYMFLKGLTFLIRCGNVPLVKGKNEDNLQVYRRAWVRRLLSPTRYAHGDVALMCLATAQLGYSWIILPSTLPGAYIKFWNKHGGKSKYVMDSIRDMCRETSLGRPTRQLPCDVVHPQTSCSSHSVSFFPEALARAIPVYIPVYIIPALLIHRQKLLSGHESKEIWLKIAKSSLRSSLFLSLYCTLAWRSVCLAFQTTRSVTGQIVASSCWVAGIALFVEKKSRRMELSTYAFSRAIESFALSLVEWGILPRSSSNKQPRIDVLLFSMASAAICHCYSDHCGQRRDVFAGKYLNFFDFIFGNTGFSNAGRIRHVPTNSDLVLMADKATGLSKRVRSIARSVGNDLHSLSRVVSSSSDLETSSSDEHETKD